MASEILNSKTSYRGTLLTAPISETAVKAMDTIIIYGPVANTQKMEKIGSAIKKVLNTIDNHPVEIFLGASAVACMTVVTGGAALPVMAVCAVAVALW